MPALPADPAESRSASHLAGPGQPEPSLPLVAPSPLVWGLLLALGLLDLLLGAVVALSSPHVVGALMMVTGCVALLLAVRLRRHGFIRPLH